MDNYDDLTPLPPRREKHGSKKDNSDFLTDPEIDHAQSSFQSIQSLDSRSARRKALKEFTLNPQGYRPKSTKPEQVKKVPKKKNKNKKRNKSSNGLLPANIILALFLILIGSIFFFIIYNY